MTEPVPNLMPSGSVVPPVILEAYHRRTPVRPFRGTLQCPSCLKGQLIFTGFKRQDVHGVTGCQHRCACGYELIIIGTEFPRLEFQDIEEKNGVI